jgi:competence protein ComEA
VGRRRGEHEPVAAARVARVLPAAGGWVPPPLEEPDLEEPGLEEPGLEEPELEVSWAPRADPSPERPLLPDTVRGGVLDPGRRGVAALLAVGLVAALAAGSVALRGRPQEVLVPSVQAEGEPLPGAPEEEAPAPGELVVSVAGEVVAPGLVRLPPGSRVDDAVRAAGGVAPGADPGLLNLARKLVDGELVLVGVEAPPGTAGAPGGAAGGLLDLNAAGASDFEQLPGIGPVLAERIAEWRTEHGPFRSVDQLREVPGIGESKYAAVKAKVTV